MRLLVNGRPLTDFGSIREDRSVSWCEAFITYVAREASERIRYGGKVVDVEEVPPPGALVRRPR